jgi:hypothetical protein
MMMAGSAATVCARFPPPSWNMITAPRPPRGIAAATIFATPGLAQSAVPRLVNTTRYPSSPACLAARYSAGVSASGSDEYGIRSSRVCIPAAPASAF